MSADRPDPAAFVDDREPVDHDPYGIVPDSFVSDWNATVDREISTIPEALRVAESAPPTTPRSQMPRCPECASTKIRTKTGGDQAHKRDEPYKCSACNHHFETPAPSDDDRAPGDQATLREVLR